MLPQLLAVQLKITTVDMQLRKALIDIHHAKHRRNGLRNNQGNRAARHAPAEGYNKYQCQNNIDNGRDNQKVQRRLAVAQRTHNAAQKVIGHHCKQAVDDNHYISIGISHQLRRNIHQHQRRPHNEMHNAHNKQHKGAAQHNAGTNTAPHTVHILSAIALACNDSKAVAQANRQHHRQHKQRRHCAHCRQRLHANRAADDDDIRNIIQLLKNITYQKRHREGDYQLQRCAIRHIF